MKVEGIGEGIKKVPPLTPSASPSHRRCLAAEQWDLTVNLPGRQAEFGKKVEKFVAARPVSAAAATCCYFWA
jgi:hypothetical protein